MPVSNNQNEINPLIESYEKGDFNLFCQHIENGENIDCISNPSGESLICRVLRNNKNIKNYKEFFDKLISSGAIIKKNDKHYDALTLSIEYQNDPYYMEKLLKAGADIDFYGMYFFGDENYIEYDPPIFTTLRTTSIKKLELLLKYNPDVKISDRQGDPLLNCLMSFYDDSLNYDNYITKASSILVKAGAVIDETGSDGSRPIHIWAKYSKNIEILNLFINNNVDINSRDIEGNTPLLISLSAKNKTTTKILIDKKANLNTQNFSGQTASMISIVQEDFQTLKRLLRSNCNVLLSDDEGKNIAHYLAEYIGENYDRKIMKLFLKLLKDNPGLSIENNDGQTPTNILEEMGMKNIKNL